MGKKTKAPGRCHVKKKQNVSLIPDKGAFVQRKHKDKTEN